MPALIVDDLTVLPKPANGHHLDVWLGGQAPSELRRVGRLADGWLASAYNTTPAQFADAWSGRDDRIVRAQAQMKSGTVRILLVAVGAGLLGIAASLLTTGPGEGARGLGHRLGRGRSVRGEGLVGRSGCGRHGVQRLRLHRAHPQREALREHRGDAQEPGQRVRRQFRHALPKSERRHSGHREGQAKRTAPVLLAVLGDPAAVEIEAAPVRVDAAQQSPRPPAAG